MQVNVTSFSEKEGVFIRAGAFIRINMASDALCVCVQCIMSSRLSSRLCVNSKGFPVVLSSVFKKSKGIEFLKLPHSNI